MAGDVGVIWVNQEGEYFCKPIWTGGITLIWLRKLGGARKGDCWKIDRDE
jgi:hypothetical protein